MMLLVLKCYVTRETVFGALSWTSFLQAIRIWVGFGCVEHVMCLAVYVHLVHLRWCDITPSLLFQPHG